MAGWNYYADGTDDIAKFDGKLSVDDIDITTGNNSQLNVSGINVFPTGTGSSSGVYIANSGTGIGLDIHQLVDSESNKNTLFVHTEVAQTNVPLVRFIQDHPESTQRAFVVQQDGSGDGIFIDKNSGTRALYIDMDTTAAGQLYGLEMDVDTTGGGNPVGINFNSFSSGEALFKCIPSMSGVTVQAGAFAIASGTTIYYVPFYSS